MLNDDTDFPQSLAFAFLEQYEAVGLRLECIPVWVDNTDWHINYTLRVLDECKLDIPKTEIPRFMFDEMVLKMAVTKFLIDAFLHGSIYSVPVTFDMINAVYEMVKAILFYAGAKDFVQLVCEPSDLKQLLKNNRIGQFKVWLSVVEDDE